MSGPRLLSALGVREANEEIVGGRSGCRTSLENSFCTGLGKRLAYLHLATVSALKTLLVVLGRVRVCLGRIIGEPRHLLIRTAGGTLVVEAEHVVGKHVEVVVRRTAPASGAGQRQSEEYGKRNRPKHSSPPVNGGGTTNIHGQVERESGGLPVRNCLYERTSE